MRNIIKFSVVAVIATAFWMGTTCAAQNFPSGSYQQTCRNIGVKGNRLEADCDSGNGQWNRTSLRNFQNCGEIANINGRLRCSGNGNGGYNNGAYSNGGYRTDRDRDGDRDRDNDRDR